MITELGKELRKLRIDRGERLLDMSKAVGKSSSFLSAVERGSKSPPTGFEELIISTYQLISDQAEVLRRAADLSRSAFTIETSNPAARDTAGLMARRIDSLSSADLAAIRKILEEKDASGD